MSETLKNRVGRIIAGSIHALLSRIEDQAPESFMEQALREADGVIDEVRHELGLVTANRHLAQRQHSALNAQHATLDAQISQAFAQSREDLAHAAVARQLDIEAQLPVLEGTLADQSRQEQELLGYVAALLAKKREMREALDDYRRSRLAASAAPGMGRTVAGGNTQARMDAASGAFDRLYARQTGLSPTQHASDLQQAAKLRELDELVRENKIAERIAQIKAGQA